MKPPSDAMEIPQWQNVSPLLKNVVISALQKELATNDASDARHVAEMTVMQTVLRQVQGAVAATTEKPGPKSMTAISGVLTDSITGGIDAGRMYVRAAFLSALQELSK